MHFPFCFLVLSVVLSSFFNAVRCLTADIFARYGLPVSQSVLENYGYFPPRLRDDMRDQVKEMFYFGYDNYMQHAWPKDELNPIHCNGRGPDWNNPSNININDVLGNFSLTLIDSFGSLLVFGNYSEFHKAVRLVIDTVSFDQDVTVQVFESTIRVVGGLLSAHLFLTDPSILPQAAMLGYQDELLKMAVDLTERLSRAFEDSPTGIPHPRVNLRYGVLEDIIQRHENCLAGAGSLMIEFGLVSALTGNMKYYNLAKGAVEALWNRRINATGLLGNSIDIRTGVFLDYTSGLGAGMDSFYEYLLKSYILFADENSLSKWKEIYGRLRMYGRMGETSCGVDSHSHPFFVNVDMSSGNTINSWVDSLSSSFPAVQVLNGDLPEAICLFNFYSAIWKRYGGMPERFDWLNQRALIPLYPLRPELAESTYYMYRATKNPFYLHFGKQMVEDINKIARVRCGFATVHSLLDGSHEDRMESFFLSETLKYLYLLFDEENFVNVNEEKLLFTTEGHIIPLSSRYHKMAESSVNLGLTNQTKMDVCESGGMLLKHALPVQEITWKDSATARANSCTM